MATIKGQYNAAIRDGLLSDDITEEQFVGILQDPNTRKAYYDNSNKIIPNAYGDYDTFSKGVDSVLATYRQPQAPVTEQVAAPQVPTMPVGAAADSTDAAVAMLMNNNRKQQEQDKKERARINNAQLHMSDEDIQREERIRTIDNTLKQVGVERFANRQPIGDAREDVLQQQQQLEQERTALQGQRKSYMNEPETVEEARENWTNAWLENTEEGKQAKREADEGYQQAVDYLRDEFAKGKTHQDIVADVQNKYNSGALTYDEANAELNKRLNDAFIAENKETLEAEYQTLYGGLAQRAYKADNGWLKKQEERIGTRAVQEAIDEGVDELNEAMRADYEAFSKTVGNGFGAAQAKSNYINTQQAGILGAASQLYQETETILESTVKGEEKFGTLTSEILRHSKDKLANLASFGMSDVNYSAYQADVLKKIADAGAYDNPESVLDRNEQVLYNAIVSNVAAQLLRAENTSHLANAGKLTADMLPFVRDIIMGKGLLGGFSAAAEKGLMRGIVRSIGTGKWGKLLANLGKTGVGLVESTAISLISPSTYQQVFKEEAQIDPTSLHLTDEGWKVDKIDTKHAIDAFAAAHVGMTKELFTETGGMTQFAIRLAQASPLGKYLRKSKVGQIAQMFDNTIAGKLFNQTAYHGFAAELSEEWENTFYDAVLAAMNKDNAGKRMEAFGKVYGEFVKPETQVPMLISFALPAIFGGAVSTGQIVAINSQYNRAYKNLRDTFMKYGATDEEFEDALNELRAARMNMNIEDYPQLIRGLATTLSGGSQEQAEEFAAALSAYTVADANLGAIQEKHAKKQRQVQQLIRDIQASEERITSNTHADSGMMYHVNVNGQPGYVVSGTLELNTYDNADLPIAMNSDVVTVRMEDGSVKQIAANQLQLLEQPQAAEGAMAFERRRLTARMNNLDRFKVGDVIYMTENGQPIDGNSSRVVDVTDEGVVAEIIDPNGQPNTTVIPHEVAESGLSTSDELVEEGVESVVLEMNNGSLITMQKTTSGDWMQVAPKDDSMTLLSQEDLDRFIADGGAKIVNGEQTPSLDVASGNRVVSEETGEIEQPIEQPAAPTPSKYPTTQEGKLDWGQMDVPTVTEAAIEKFGDKNTAKEYAELQIAQAKKAVAAANKKKATSTDADEFVAQKNAIRQEQQAAQAELSKWENVLLGIANYKTAEEQAAAEQAAAQAAAVRAQRKQTIEGVGGTNMAERLAASPRIDGNAGSITAADGTKIPGHYVLVSANALTPSHNPNANFAPSEGYPTVDGQSINDRDYQADQEEQAKVQQVAQTYDGRAITNMPIMSDEGLVYSGNGRTMAGQLAAANGTDGAYKEALLENAKQYGFTTEQVESVPNARVVFMTDERLPYNTTTLALFNQTEQQTQSNTASAAANVRKLTPEAVGHIIAAVQEYDTVDAFFGDSRAPFELVNRLIADGIISERDKAAFVDNGRLTNTGKDRLTALLFGTAFDEKTIRLLGDNAKVRNSVMRALPQILENKGLGDFSLFEHINNAIAAIYDMDTNGMSFFEFTRQIDIEGKTASDKYTAFELLLVDEMVNGGVQAFRDVLSGYNARAKESAGGQLDMFTGEVLTTEELTKQILQEYEQRKANERGGAQPESAMAGTSESDGEKIDTQSVEQIKLTDGRVVTLSTITDKDFALLGDITPIQRSLMAVRANAVQNPELKLKTAGYCNTTRRLLFNELPSEKKDLPTLRDIYFRTQQEYVNTPNKTQEYRFAADEVLKEIRRRLSYVDPENYPPKQGSAIVSRLNDAELAVAEAETDTDPTEAQKKAENYKQGHVTLWGLPFTLENPKGSVRRGTDANGKQWEQVMNNTYGKIRRTEGVDGDHIDVFFGPNLHSDKVFVVDQLNVDTKEFDEHKVMLGFDSMEEAQTAYLSNYEKGWQGMGPVTETTMDEFKKWIDSSHRKTKPFNEYKSVKQEGASSGVTTPVQKSGKGVEKAKENIEKQIQLEQKYRGKEKDASHPTVVNIGEVEDAIKTLSIEELEELEQVIPNIFSYDKNDERYEGVDMEGLRDDVELFIKWAKESLQSSGVTNRETTERTPREKPAMRIAKAEAEMQEFASKLGAQGVHLISDKEQLPKEEGAAYRAIRNGANVMGWYNPKTNQVYIYLPNANNLQEVYKTLLHEFVAHKGLRDMLGKEKFDQLCHDVWDMMSEQDKLQYALYVKNNTAVGSKAMQEQMDSMTEEEKVALLSDTKLQLAAADEYMAHFAETGVSEQERSIWQRIVDAVRDLLRKAGINLRLTDADIARLLYESSSRLSNDMTMRERSQLIAKNNKVVENITTNAESMGLSTDTRFRLKMTSRGGMPKPRGEGWTKKKILRYLKETPTRSGLVQASNAIADFDSVEDLKQHMFYHGTQFGSDKLKPSITMTDRFVERYGGGGYGQKYWGISITTDKKIASNFSGYSNSVRIYPIILLKDANVIEGKNYQDAADVEENIEKLWNDGVDAVWIGDKNKGEKELFVLNPKAIVNIGTADSYRVFGLNTESNPLRVISEDEIIRMYDTAKVFANTKKPRKPMKPSSFDDNFNKKSEEQYQKELSEWETKMDEYNRSEEKKIYDELLNLAQQDVRFRIGTQVVPMGDNTLVGLHNLSATKLRKAIKQGGLANPSAAVIDIAKQDHEQYGEISLVMPSSLVDSATGQNAGTYTGDIWSPTYPYIERKMNSKGTDKYYETINKVFENAPVGIKNRIQVIFVNMLDNQGDPDNLAYWYMLEKGIAPTDVIINSGISDDIKQRFEPLRDKHFVGDMNAEERGLLLSLAAELEGKTTEDLLQAAQEAKARYEAVLANEKASGFSKRIATEAIDEIDTYGVRFNLLSETLRKINEAIDKDGGVDVNASIWAAVNYVQENGLKDDFDSWLDNLDNRFGIEEVIFDGYNRNGDRKYIKHTLENASRIMNQQPIQNASSHGGLSATRGQLVERMSTLAQIRANKHRLAVINEYEDEQWKAMQDEWFNKIINPLSNMQQIDSNHFINMDIAEQRLLEAIMKKDPIAHLNREYGYSIAKDSEFAKSLKDLMQRLKELPSKYFETKFKRPVYLNEFVSAVVPQNLPQDLKDGLANAGVELYEYDESQDGSRREATLQATESDDVRFLIKNNEENLHNSKKSSTFAAEMEKLIESDAVSAQEVKQFIDKVRNGRKEKTLQMGRLRMDGTSRGNDLYWCGAVIGEAVILHQEKSGVSSQSSLLGSNLFIEVAKQLNAFTEYNEFVDALGAPIGQGQEAIVWVKDDDGDVVKALHYNALLRDNTQQVPAIIERISWFNHLFPENQLSLNQVLGLHNNNLYVEVTQDYVDGEHPNFEDWGEVGAFINQMKAKGFEATIERGGEIILYKDNFEVRDLVGRNVIKDEDGVFHVIDANISQEVKEKPEIRFSVDNSSDDIRFRISNENQRIFVSNAEKAVEGIKQDKATPQQWLAMLEKNGGIKAGEDKWLGLSEWLKEQDKKSITKQEILDFISENQIQIEEVEYVEGSPLEEFSGLTMEQEIKFGDYANEFGDFVRNEELTPEEAYQEMIDKYGEDFSMAFELEDDRIYPARDAYGGLTEAAKYFLGEDSKTIHGTRLQYTTKGLENNREIALTVPTIESWSVSDEIHFGDAGEGRAVAWVRFGETIDEDGSKVLVIDEIQSKRHQEGREKGYKDNLQMTPESLRKLANIAQEKYEAYTKELESKYKEDYVTIYPDLTDAERTRADELEQDVYSAQERLESAMENERRIPYAPFDKNWHELAMKRMLRYAAENGYDYVAWTTGAQQAERYNIGAVVDNINAGISVMGDRLTDINYRGSNAPTRISHTDDGSIISISGNNSENFAGAKNISDIVGKELSIKILSQTEKGSDKRVEYRDLDLSVGGEGMKGFYDRMLPSFVSKYTKKWGAKVQDINLPNLEESAQTMHAVNVTESMKEDVMAGQPMFRITEEENRTPLTEAQQLIFDGLRDVAADAGIDIVEVSEEEAIKAVENTIDAESAIVDREGNAIGDGSVHAEYDIREDLLKKYPQISHHVSKSSNSESVYVTYENTDPKYPTWDRPKVTLRFSWHNNNAVRFGDQLNGYAASDAEILYRLGLAKRVFVPTKQKHISRRYVSKKDIASGKYEVADKTFEELFALPVGTDISAYQNKVAKDSNILILGDKVGEYTDPNYGRYEYAELLTNPITGKTLGYAQGGTIYLTKAGMTPETMVHEYTHVWAKAMQRNNRAGWENIKEIFKKSPLWDHVKNDPNYKDRLTTDDAICSEVLARFSGKQGAERLSEVASEFINEEREKGGMLGAARVRQFINHARQAIKSFWKWVGKNLFGITKFDSMEDVADRVLYDLLNATELDVDRSDNTIESSIEMPSAEFRAAMKAWNDANPYPIYMEGESLGAFSDRLTAWKEARDAYRAELWRKSQEKIESADPISEPMVAGSKPVRKKDETPLEYAQRLKQWQNAQIDSQLSEEYTAEMNRLAGTVEKAKRAFVDAALPIEEWQKWLIEHGATMTSESNAYQDMFLAQGRVSNAAEELRRDIIQKLTRKIAAIIESKKLDDVDLRWQNMDVPGTKRTINGNKLSVRELIGVYCQAKDCEEAEEKGLPDRGKAGFKNNLDVEFTDIVNAVETRLSREDITELWHWINQATKYALDYDLASGRISQDTYDEFADREYYVPQRGWRERDESGLIEEYEPVGKRGHDPYNAALVKARGRQSLAADPFAYIMSIDHSSIVSSENNKIKQKMLQFCLDNEEIGLKTGAFRVKKYWLIHEIDPDTGKIRKDEDGTPITLMSYTEPKAEDFKHDKKVKDEVRRIEKEIAKRKKALEKELSEHGDTNYAKALQRAIANSEAKIEDLNDTLIIAFGATNTHISQRTRDEKLQHEVQVMKDGQRYVIELQDEKVANAINKKFKQHQEALFNVSDKMRNATRFMSAMLTQYNPEFAASNFVRDFQVAAMTLTNENPKLLPAFLKNFAACQRAVMAYAFADKVKDRTKYVDSDMGRLLEEYMKSGAPTGFSYMQDLKTLRKDFDSMVNEGKLARGVRSAAGIFSMLTEISETSVRFAAYAAARQAGWAINDAAYMSKELTTNFDRAGEMADSGWMSWFSFMRATINGNVKFFRAFRKLPVAYGITAAVYFAMGIINQFANPNDPEDEVWASDFVRENNFVIGKWRIPAAHFMRIFYSAGVNMASWMQGERTFGHAVYNSSMSAFNEILPNYMNIPGAFTEWSDEMERVTAKDPKAVIRELAPTPISPFVDVWANRNFMGGTINREPFVKTQENTKDILMAKDNTLPIYRAITEGIYTAVGGDLNSKYKSDDNAWTALFDVSGSSLEHITEGYLTGGMDMLATTANMIYDAVQGNELTPDKITFIRKFYNQYTPQRAYDQQYWLLKGRVQEYQRKLNDYEENNPDKYELETRSKQYKAYEETNELIWEKIESPTTEDVKRLMEANQQWIKARK